MFVAIYHLQLSDDTFLDRTPDDQVNSSQRVLSRT